MKTKRGLSIVLIISMMAYLMSGLCLFASADESTFVAEKPFEAEAGELSGEMKKTKDTTASGKYFISASTGEKVNEPLKCQPEASYTFTVPADGEYQFWTRSFVKNESSNSFWARFDENAYASCSGPIGTDYAWMKHFSAQLNAGAHTLDIVHRENNWNFDEICITADPEKSIGKDATAVLNPTETTKPSATPTVTDTGDSATKKTDWSKVDTSFEIGEGSSLLIEAENTYVDKVIGAVVDVSSASGKKGVQLTVNCKDQIDGELAGALSMKLTAKNKGGYKIWARTAAKSGGNDSAYISVDGSKYKQTGLPITDSEDSFAWSMIGSVKFSDTEEHTIRIRPRENGSVFDQFVLTKDASYIPEGIVKEAPEVKEGVILPLPADTYPMPSITPPPEHPRLLMRPSDLPMIRENMTKPQNQNALKRWNEFLAQDVDGVLAASDNLSKNNYSTSVLAVIESRAFDYVINGNEENGKKAIDAMMNVLNTAYFATDQQDATRSIGHTIFTASEVYDWCHALLSEKQKNDIVIWCEEIAAEMEIGWPPKNQGAIVGHGCETQLQRDLLSFAIATYDEHPDIYNYIGGRYLSEYVEPRNYYYQSHSYHQGYSYNVCRYGSDMWAGWIYYRLSGKKIFTDDAQYPVYYTEYTRRPDGAIITEGDAGIDVIGANQTYFSDLIPAFLAASLYDNPYLKYQAAVQSKGYDGFTYSFVTLTPVQFLLFNNPDVEARPMTELANTKYFGSPNGTMIARTDWNMGINSPTAMAYMRISERWAANHQHLDAGTFQLYYRGMLATNPGQYTSYGNKHDYNFNKETISHNALLIYDPNENTGNIENSGGQKRMGSEPGTMDIWMNDDVYKTGEVLGHEFGPDPLRPEYSYISGDVASAYTDKVSEVRRSMVFFDNDSEDIPALFFIMDKVVSTNKDFKKTFQMFSVQEPEVVGNTTTIKRDTDGYNGKLVSQTLYPTDAKIEKVGGPGKQWLVNSTNYVPNGIDPESTDYGWGKITVSPAKASEEDYFLNAMYMTDADKQVNAKAELIENETILGGKLDNTVAIFVKDKQRATNDISFNFSGNGEYKILVAGIKEGGWSVSKDGTDLGEQIATKDGGTIYFKGEAGTYKLEYTNPSAVREPQVVQTPTDDGITVKLNSQYMYTDVAPTIINDRTLVPMRAIFENLGADVSWDDDTETVTGIRGDISVTLKIGDTKAYVSGREVELDVPAMLLRDRTMVPIRFVSESLGARVDWEEFSKTVFITPVKEFKPLSPYAVQIVDYRSSVSGESADGYKAYDGDEKTRWAAEGFGEWIIFELKEESDIASYYTQYYNGSSRKYLYDLYASTDGENYTLFLSTSTKGEGDKEEITLDKPVRAKYIKMVGKANTVNAWNSLHEIEFRTK